MPHPQFLHHLSPSFLQAEQNVGQMLYDYVGLTISLLEVMPGYGKWLIQAPHPPVPGGLAQVTLIDSWELPLLCFALVLKMLSKSTCLSQYSL